MTKLMRMWNKAMCLSLSGLVCLVLVSASALGQEENPKPTQVTHNAPESVTGTLEGNRTDLLSSWRWLSDLAVRLFSGNEAELLSGNAPELLSGNETNLLSGNDPSLLSGNEVVLFSNNTLQIHLTEGGLKNIQEAQRQGAAVLSARNAQAEALAKQLSTMRSQMQKLADENKALKSRMAELEAAEE